jgi:hypothetical protein
MCRRSFRSLTNLDKTGTFYANCPRSLCGALQALFPPLDTPLYHPFQRRLKNDPRRSAPIALRRDHAGTLPLVMALAHFHRGIPLFLPQKPLFYAGQNRVSAQTPYREHPRQYFWVFRAFFPLTQTGSFAPHFTHSLRGRISSSLPGFALRFFRFREIGSYEAPISAPGGPR